MIVDTPARIAVLGAGPIGLEAALYARFLGYEVVLIERGRVAEHVLRWGHVRMFSPFGMNRSPLGLAALAAHDPEYRPPADDELLTGNEWVARYLDPLAHTDLLADHLHEHVAVVNIGRQTLRKTELPGNPKRAESPFRLLLRENNGGENAIQADVVIDTTGVFGRPNWLGPGGMPAIGEIAAHDAIEYGLPDVLGADRPQFAGRHTLLIGSGHSAATTIVALADLAASEPATQVTWITRRDEFFPNADAGPLAVIADDRLLARRELCQRANHCAHQCQPAITHLTGTSVESIARDGDRFQVQLAGAVNETRVFDQIVANVGYRGDPSLFDELQVHLCYATSGPMQLAAALLGKGTASADCLDQTSRGAQTLRNPEPNFYILGAKSYGRNSNFLIAVGLQQIRELFVSIVGREGLNLYNTIQR